VEKLRRCRRYVSGTTCPQSSRGPFFFPLVLRTLDDLSALSPLWNVVHTKPPEEIPPLPVPLLIQVHTLRLLLLSYLSFSPYPLPPFEMTQPIIRREENPLGVIAILSTSLKYLDLIFGDMHDPSPPTTRVHDKSFGFSIFSNHTRNRCRRRGPIPFFTPPIILLSRVLFPPLPQAVLFLYAVWSDRVIFKISFQESFAAILYSFVSGGARLDGPYPYLSTPSHPSKTRFRCRENLSSDAGPVYSLHAPPPTWSLAIEDDSPRSSSPVPPPLL